ncbi:MULTISPECIES: TonB-dependent receptor domain-containing protein [unclassified Colwellia]|uniref:TonB-dependent receptor domain-containing protein n=1 Tax=unclassified Colwellia TaxID=196834 RepID=UPI0015F562B3|nr:MULTISPECIES: TonB-dependent receptor [unclassified Colwellia]MBA6256507.1 TonB-dependent receptor [Colwellia sp. MB3u-28]MBA6260290.1 TonB-dependent receptor [Colwellia sp. MB3u-41]
MSNSRKKSLIALAISSTFAFNVLAEEVKTQESTMEEVSVVAKKSSHANHEIDVKMAQQQSSITSVLALMDNLPGISINEGDAFGGDDWSTSITMRGFSIDGNQQQLGMTIDGIPNGGSNYGGGAKANRYLDSENMETIQVSQGTSDISSASLDALGGTFNFVSAMHAFEKTTKFALTKGDHDATRYFVRHDTGLLFDNTYAYASYSSTSTSRWVGEGSNGGMAREHAEFKFVTELGQLNITGRLSYDDADEDNYNSVSKTQFDQSPDWDQLTWNWTGVPHFDQMFAEGWSTLRENTLGYLKFEYDISSTMGFQISPYMHNNTGRGDWIPPYLVSAVNTQGEPTTEGGTIDSQYGFTDQLGNPLAPSTGCTDNLAYPWDSGPELAPSCYDRSAVPVMSYRHTHYKKSRLGMTANFDWSIGINDISLGLWTETTDRDESRDWHKVIDARVYHHFDETPYWTQYSNSFQTDTLKLYAQDTLDFGDLTVNLGMQKYFVDVEKYDNFAKSVTGEVNSDSDVLLSTGVIYSVNDTTEVFAGYSENFSAIKDGVLERDSSTLNEIEPETAENIDVGVRYNNENIDFSATYYSISFDNRITFISPGSDTSGIDYSIGTNGTYLNVGGIDSTGFEISASYRFNENWDIYSSYTNNDSTYVGNAPGFESGSKVIDSVDDMFVLSTNYTLESFRLGLSAKYTGERGDADSYTVVDFNAGYGANIDSNVFKSFDLAFVVNNLTDESFLSTGTGNGTAFFIGAPRTASMTLTVSF